MATPNMALTLPTVGASTDVWGTTLNSAFDLIDAHDHTTGKGVQVPSAALRINADVSWSFGGTNFAITAAKAIDFTPLAASTMTSYSSALFSNSDDANNLYYRNSAGTNVQITDGSTLNVSIVGGIGGDYSSVGALLDYDDATDTYRLRQETAAAVRQFGKISCSNLQLFEYLAAGASPVPANSVRLASPAALAGSYTLTFPGALPVAAAMVQTSSAGALSFSNTTTQEITAADFNHTTAQRLVLPVSASTEATATHTKQAGLVFTSTWSNWLIAASVNSISWPITLRVGDRVTGYTVFLDKNTDNTNTVAAQIGQRITTTGVESAIGGTVTNAANAPGFITLVESSLTLDIVAGVEYYLVFTPGGGVLPAADELYSAEITYTRP